MRVIPPPGRNRSCSYSSAPSAHCCQRGGSRLHLRPTRVAPVSDSGRTRHR
jgi:hypothetical protein